MRAARCQLRGRFLDTQPAAALCCGQVRAALRRAPGLARRTRRAAFSRDVRIWHELPASCLRLGPLPPGTDLVRAAPQDAEIVEQLPLMWSSDGMIDAQGARRRMAAGHDLWVVFEAERPVMLFWTCRGSAPALAARGGWLALPPGVASAEDAVVAFDRRGARLTPLAVTEAFRRLEREGVHTFVMQALNTNRASRHAIRTLGAHETAAVTLVRFAFRSYVRVRPLGFAGHLRRLLEG